VRLDYSRRGIAKELSPHLRSYGCGVVLRLDAPPGSGDLNSTRPFDNNSDNTPPTVRNIDARQ
jgi:hypothetical protein